MGRRKKPKKKKPPQQTSLTPQEEAAVASILEESIITDPLALIARIPDSRHAQAVIERIVADKNPSIPLLLALKEGFKDKPVQKAIKRALFKLEKKGLPVDGFSKPEGPSHPIIKASQTEEPEAFLGPILNLFGSRAVLVTHYKVTKGQHMGLGLVSDEDGFHDFLYGSFSKKRTKRMKNQLSEEAGPLVKTSLSHAAAILEAAYHRHMERHPKAPPFYPDLRPWLLENAPRMDRPAIYDFIPKDQVGKRIPTDSQLNGLFSHKLMEAWLIEFERIKLFIEELLDAEKSTIVLSASQESDQKRRIRDKCIHELFPGDEQDILKQRLEEMALVFFKLEDEDNSRLCLDAALTIGQEKNALQKNPVIEFLVEKSLDFYINLVKGGTPEEKEKKEDSTSRIILP